jgi:hypothetical protein
MYSVLFVPLYSGSSKTIFIYLLIEHQSNMQELETWLDNILDAKTLADVGISLD